MQKQAAQVLNNGSDAVHQGGALLRITPNELSQLTDKAIAMGYDGVPQGDDGVYEAGFLDFITGAAKAIAPIAAFIPGVGPAISAGAAAIGGIGSILGGGEEQAAGGVGMQPAAAPAISSAQTDPSAPSVVAEQEEPSWIDKLNDIDFGGIASVLGKSMNAYDTMSGRNDDLGNRAEERAANNKYYQDQRNNLYAQAGRARPRQLPRPQYAKGGMIKKCAEGGMVEDLYGTENDPRSLTAQAYDLDRFADRGDPNRAAYDYYNRQTSLTNQMSDDAYVTDDQPISFYEWNGAPTGYGMASAADPAAPVDAPVAPEHGQVVEPTFLPPMPGDANANAQANFYLDGGSLNPNDPNYQTREQMMQSSVPTEAQAAAMMTPFGTDPNSRNPLYAQVGGAGSTWNPESLNQLGYDRGLQQHANLMDSYLEPQDYDGAPQIASAPEIAAAPRLENDNYNFGGFLDTMPNMADGGLTPTAPPPAPMNAGIGLLQEGQMNAAMQAGMQPQPQAQNMMYPQAQAPLMPQLGPQMNIGPPAMGGQDQMQGMSADPAYMQNQAMRPQGHIKRQGHERMGGQGDEIMAMVSPGEYMLSADVVSALGNGDTATGEQHLNAMVDNIRQAKYGTTQQAGMIDPTQFLPQFGNV